MRIDVRLVVACVAIGCGKPAGPSVLSVPNGTSQTAQQPEEKRDLKQPFDAAVLEESPGNQQLPPDRTLAGLSTAQVRQEVQKNWDSIRFADTSGKAIPHIAVFETEFGRFKIALLPEVAPNHVRNFVALAKAGYYNGLVFEHIIRQEGDEGKLIELVEGGCPLGTGEPGIAHLGYWLRPEFSNSLKHSPGTFGAFHDDRHDTAALRFYVTLTSAPAMDSNFTAFGHVVEGLDVVRTISKQPTTEGTVQAVKPATIRSVTIEVQDAR